MEIRKAKIKYDDGSYSESYPIGANSTEINLPDGRKLNEGYLEINENIDDLKRKNESQDDETEILRGQIRQNKSEIDKLELAVENQERKINNIKKDIAKIVFPKNYNNYVKSGDFMLFKTPSKNVLVDTERLANWSYLLECLQENEVTHLDYVFITHFHTDHAGNIQNLCIAGFIDNTTKVYAQGFNEGWMHNNNDMQYHYNMLVNCQNTYGFEYIVPDYENQIVEIDSLLNVRINNVDSSYWLTHPNGNNSVDYNDTSLILSMTYGNVKILIGGDAGKVPFEKMVADGYISESYNLFKIEHHGINNEANAITYEVMQIINPQYTVQTSTQYELSDTFDNQASNKYQKILGFKNFVTGYNNEFVSFKISNDSLIVENGSAMQSAFCNSLNKDIYVDINTTEDIQNGTQSFPFKELVQAIATIPLDYQGTINIHLADGIYSEKYNVVSSRAVTTIVGYAGIINIIGNTSDETKVVLKNGFNIKNANVNLSYITITNYNKNRAINLVNANLDVDHCILKSFEETISSNGIYAVKSNVSVRNSAISYYVTGIASYESFVDTHFVNFSNLSHAFYNRNTVMISLSNNFENNVGNVINSSDNTYSTFLEGLSCYYDSTGSNNVDIPSNFDLSKFTYLEIEIGDGNINNIYTMRRNRNSIVDAFEFENSQANLIYTKGFYLVKSGNNISLNRLFQKTYAISSGNTTVTNDNDLKIKSIKLY